jgi:acetyl/propionyl-CoA carboxylase alpha subunit
MVHAPDRAAAVSRLRRALDETAIGGVPTTLGFHRWLVDQPDFVEGRHDLRFVATAWGEGPPLAVGDRAMAAAAVLAAQDAALPAATPTPGAHPTNGERPWTRQARLEAIDRTGDP